VGLALGEKAFKFKTASDRPAFKGDSHMEDLRRFVPDIRSVAETTALVIPPDLSHRHLPSHTHTHTHDFFHSMFFFFCLIGMVDNTRTAPHASASKSLLMSLIKVLPSESTTQGATASLNCWRDVKNKEEIQTPCVYLPYLTDKYRFWQAKYVTKKSFQWKHMDTFLLLLIHF